MASIVTVQIRLIKIAQRQLGLSEEAYRSLLCSRYQNCFKGSCKELSYDQASDLIDYFKTLGFRIQKKRSRRKPPNMSTGLFPGHPMFKKIEHLRTDINWRYRDGFKRLAMKVIKKECPATTKEASMLIEALKGMKESQQKKLEARSSTRAESV